MDDNYVSPYGFGPLVDMLLDTVAAEHEMTNEQLMNLLDDLTEDQREGLDSAVDHWYNQWLTVAQDKLADTVSEFIDWETFVDYGEDDEKS